MLVLSSLIVILVLASLRSGLWPTGSLCHDDLVYLENGASSIGCVLQAPPLCDEEVKDFGLLGVEQTASLNVQSMCWLGLCMGRLQPRQQFRALHTRVLSQGLGQSLQSLSKSLDSILLQTCTSLSKLPYLLIRQTCVRLNLHFFSVYSYRPDN